MILKQPQKKEKSKKSTNTRRELLCDENKITLLGKRGGKSAGGVHGNRNHLHEKGEAGNRRGTMAFRDHPP